MKKEKIRFRIVAAAATITALLAVCLLIFLGTSENVSVQRLRSEEGYARVETYSRNEIADDTAPVGKRVEYEFQISEEEKWDRSLAFYVYHQYIQVYIEEELVYSLYPSEEIPMIKTAGSNWTVIPLYREDAGKQVRVVLTPVYKNIINRKVDFLIGSYQAMYADRLKKDFPVLLIGGLMMLLGGVFAIIGFYSLYKYRFGWHVVLFGLFAECLGLWRFFDTRFSPFLNPNRPVFLFYLSFTALVVLVIPMSLSRRNIINPRIVDVYCIAASTVCIIQFICQLLGIADLRQSITVTHILIVLCILLMCSLLFKHDTLQKNPQNRFHNVVIICLTIGAVTDLIYYYVAKTSSGLLFTMLGLLVYTIYTGVSYIDIYVKQERLLMEKEQQIMQIRASTMMNQIRSHMVFNVLNAISGMCKYDPEKADEAIVCFARYLRTNINIMENDQPVPFHKALQHLEDYMELEQVRFGDQIRFVKEIQEENFMMPSLILQPLVENAIKHGINKKPEGGTITLKTWSEGDMIYISIHDDGVGFDTNQPAREGAVGLKNVRTRLEYIINGQLDIESVPGQGTTASVCMKRKEVQE